jgi:hypothetical protein
VRKERHEQRIARKVDATALLPDVHQERDLHESRERESQRNRRRVRRTRGDDSNQKISVFEIAENEQIGGDTGGHRQSCCRFGQIDDYAGNEEVSDDRQDRQNDERGGPPRVKDQ